MIKPIELQSADMWDSIVAASTGDIATLKRLLDHDPHLVRAEYWYAPVAHFAARDGHVEAVRLLIDRGADPERNGLHDRSLIEMARERGHEEIAQMLERARDARGRVAAQPADHPIHREAMLGQIDAVNAWLDADPSLANLGSRRGLAPLHYAVLGGHRHLVTFLLDRGANIHARTPADEEAIDFAIWGDRRRRSHPDIAPALISRGATYDLTVASALGDLAGVRGMLDVDPSRVRETRPSGKRPLSAAVEAGHEEIVRLLLDRGVDPRWEEPDAPHGRSVHAAAELGSLTMVKLLLAHGADANEEIDSTSPASSFAATPEIRALLESQATGPNLWDTIWVENDAALLRRIAANPAGHEFDIGVAFTMSADEPDRLARLLDAGLRMPAVHTACQGYLVKPAVLRLLLTHGMSPDQTNWQRQTLLHWASIQDTSECAAILLDAGATITARDDEYRSTPLAWAARANKMKMVEFLLSRGAPLALPEDEPWATPLAWAERRGCQEVAAILRSHGAVR
jgi:ankyrin repeat protein